jgi:hypothetical protein
MALRCIFRYDDGSYCKRWAKKDSRYCHAHRPPAFRSAQPAWPGLHPFTRLAAPTDLFDLLRESLNAARMGTMPPGQAASIATLSYAWLKAYERLSQYERVQALEAQILPTLLDASSAAEAERLAAATDETERAADLIAELDHIAANGPEAEPPAPVAAADSLLATDVPQVEPGDDSSLPSPPVQLREAQAKLEAMLAEQRAGESGVKPNGGGSS